MKTKIFNALKTEYANLGLSEKALNGVASLLEKTVTTDDDITTAIKEVGVSSMLKILQSEVDTERQKAGKYAKELEQIKASQSSGNGEGGVTVNSKENENEKAIAELTATLKSLQEQVSQENKKKNETAMLQQLTERLRGENCTNDFILKTTLSGFSLNDEDTLESLTSRYKDAYNANYKEAYGNGAHGFAGGFGMGQQANDENEFAGVVSRLKSSGVLKDTEKK